MCCRAPVLRALAQVAAQGARVRQARDAVRRNRRPAARSLALIALGYRGLSMSAASVGPVKAAIIAADAGAFTDYLDKLLSEHDGAPSIREKLRAFADGKGVPL